MPDGYQIDPDTLDQVARALSKAGDELGGAPAGPESVDAGPLTGHFTRMVSKLIKDADQMSTGLLAAGGEVAQARQNYLAQEERGQQQFRPHRP
jgi:hypothetical protein